MTMMYLEGTADIVGTFRVERVTVITVVISNNNTKSSGVLPRQDNGRFATALGKGGTVLNDRWNFLHTRRLTRRC